MNEVVKASPLLFSIIIANYNKAENIPALLSSIFGNYQFEDFEVIFLDDLSTDGSVQEAGRFPVQLHASEEHAGPAALRNIGARRARGEYLLFMDSDVILLPETLQLFREICLTGDCAALVGMEELPPVVDNWVGYFRTLQIQDFWGEHRGKQAFLNVWGATFGAVRKDLFLKYGGFNESFKGADVEDYELGNKIMTESEILFVPRLAYRHTYRSLPELLVKQFKRAAQIMNLDADGSGKHSYYGVYFKFAHVLSGMVLLSIAASLWDHDWLYLAVPLLILKIAIHKHLLLQAFRLKGPLFLAYCFSSALMTSLFVISGAFYGKLARGAR
jgi:glycosyltransferase involved in cell wall biosynthesis